MKNINELYLIKSECLGWGVGWSAGRDSFTGVGVCVSDDAITINHLFGPAPTWRDVLEALRFEDIMGDILNVGRDMFEKSGVDGGGNMWRMERHVRLSGAEEIRLRVRDDAANRYNTGGKVVCHLHISCDSKLNEGIPRMTLAQFYVLVAALFETNYDRCDEYAGSVRRSPKYDGEWNSPGCEVFGGA